MKYYQASPHRFGQGKVHMVSESSDEHPYANFGDSYDGTRMMCGKLLTATPGKFVPEGAFRLGEHCLGCQKVEANREEAKKRHQTYQTERAERERLQKEEDRQWWREYSQYLLSYEWRSKHRLVLTRADYLCEGCRKKRAIQVHHRKYPQGVLPGSVEWIQQEMLFDLVAVCDDCHYILHPDRF